MTLTTVNLTPHVGSEIKVDKKTLSSGGAVAAELRRLLEERGVLIARGIGFDDAEQVAFAKTLGIVRLGAVRTEGPEGIMKVTFDTKENPLYGDYSKGYFRGTFYWHVDGTYDEVPPLASILTPRVLSPAGGQTEFASTYAAYEELPPEDKALISDLKVLHTIEAAHRLYDPDPDAETLKLWSSYPTRVRPLVWKHKSGRKSLGLGANCSQIVGMDSEESDALIRRLMSWTVQPRFVYQHQWQLGDMLIWDNTGTMHRVLEFDVKCGRRLHRVTLEGEEFHAESA